MRVEIDATARMRLAAVGLMSFLLVTSPAISGADWLQGQALKATSDGLGGTLLVWVENRTGLDDDLFAQRLDASGNPTWGGSGVPICSAPGDQGIPDLLADGSGGVFVAWEDLRTASPPESIPVRSQIFAQHMDATGDRLWGVGGVSICGANGGQHNPALVADGVGGFIVAWASQGYLRAQRVSYAGTPLWSACGVVASTAWPVTDPPIACPDGAGGAVVVFTLNSLGPRGALAQRVTGDGDLPWGSVGASIPFGSGLDEDLYVAAPSDSGSVIVVAGVFDVGDQQEHLYARRLDAAGQLRWTAPTRLAFNNHNQWTARIASDGAGGAFVLWKDGSPSDGYVAQHVDRDGARLWNSAGVEVGRSSLFTFGYTFDCSPDGAGGMAATWKRQKFTLSGNEFEIVAQGVAPSGALRLPGGPVRLTVVPGANSLPVVLPAGGGAIVSWLDERSGDPEVYCQRLDPAWIPTWGANGRRTSRAAGLQERPTIVGDSLSGWIAVWQDKRTGDYAVYCRKVSDDGTSQWSTLPVSTSTEPQQDPIVASDGSGGAFILWRDFANDDEGDLRAQHVSAGGSMLWGAQGVPVCEATGSQREPSLIADGNGGMIAAWTDERAYSTVYVQRLAANGSPAWTTNGLGLFGGFHQPALTTDGAGGAIIGFVYRFSNSNVYASRVTAGGTLPWSPGGVVLVCGDPDEQTGPRVVSDAHGGAILAWTDWRNDELGCYAQRVDSAGTTRWNANGVAVNPSGSDARRVAIAADGSGGALLAWNAAGSGLGVRELQIRRVDALGAMPWGTNPQVARATAGDPREIALDADGVGGAAVVWAETSDLDGAGDLRAQRVLGDGALGWGPDGIPLCTSPGRQRMPALRCAGRGAVFVWADRRDLVADIVYASRVDAAGNLVGGWQAGGLTPVLVAARAPSVHEGVVTLEWDVVGMESRSFVVERKGDVGHEWVPLAEVVVDSQGRLHFADARVPAPGGYTYAIRVVGDERFVRLGAVWTRIEPSSSFGLLCEHVGGAAGVPSVVCKLADGADARLEAFDLGGRRVWWTSWGAGPASERVVRPDEFGFDRAGVYFLRLVQGNRSARARLIVLP